MLKSFKKPFVIVPIVALGVIILFYLGIHICFNNTSTWKYCVEDFDTYREDFEMVAEFCQNHVAQNEALENENIIFVYNSTKKELLCDWNVIETSETMNKSFENVKSAFPNKDAQFDSITVENGKVYFETHNGLYSVVYSEEEKPQLVDGVNLGKSRRIDGNWYHVVKK